MKFSLLKVLGLISLTSFISFLGSGKALAGIRFVHRNSGWSLNVPGYVRSGQLKNITLYPSVAGDREQRWWPSTGSGFRGGPSKFTSFAPSNMQYPSPCLNLTYARRWNRITVYNCVPHDRLQDFEMISWNRSDDHSMVRIKLRDTNWCLEPDHRNRAYVYDWRNYNIPLMLNTCGSGFSETRQLFWRRTWN